MSDKHSGSCLCGAVRFEITGDFKGFFLCHCQRCRKGTGSAHAANLFAPQATLDWLSGEDSVKIFHVAGTRHQRCFCAQCGSALPRVQNGAIVAPAGSFDNDIEKQPDAHIFVGDRANWDEHLETVPRFDTLPPGMDDRRPG